MTARCTRFVVLPAVLLSAGIAGCTQADRAEPRAGQTVSSTKAGGQRPATTPHAFRGKVEKVDPAINALTVNGEDVPGWMAGMTMVFGVDNEDVLGRIAVGDRITATVYDGDFKTLYDVKASPDNPAK